MGACVSGVTCRVVEWAKRSTLRWFSHTERIKNEALVKKVCEYVSEIEGLSRRRRPLGRWKDGVKENMSERGATSKEEVFG